MILDPVNNIQPSKKEEEALQERERVQEEYNPDDLPPDYTSVLENGGAGTSSAPPPPPTSPPLAMPIPESSSRSSSSRNLPDLKPSNFVYLSRSNSSVKGVWIIDPSLVIPSAFLPPLQKMQTEETRENLYLNSSNGTVDAEVYLLPRTPVKECGDPAETAALADAKTTLRERPHVVFRGRSSNGSVNMRIHEVPPEQPKSDSKSAADEEKRPYLHVDCWSSNGSVNISIPRSFHGPISISTRNGNVHFSESVKPLLTNFSEFNGGQRSFLGDFDARKWVTASDSNGEWIGDMLKAESMNGNVKVSFDDEQRGSGSSRTFSYAVPSNLSRSGSKSQGSSFSRSSRSGSKSQGGFFSRIFGGL